MSFFHAVILLNHCYKHAFYQGSNNDKSVLQAYLWSLIKAVTMLNNITNISLFQAVDSGKSLSQMSLIVINHCHELAFGADPGQC
jgi:hypothetical protein